MTGEITMMVKLTKLTRLLCYQIVPTLLLVSTSVDLQAQTVLTIDTIEYDAANVKLVAQGQSDTLNLVFLSDEITLEAVTQTQANDDGAWSVALSNLTSIPCRISATSGGKSVYAEVVNAPANCSSVVLSQELTARIYSEKLCDTCHGPTGSDGAAPDIAGTDTPSIERGIAVEVVHEGITVSQHQAEALAVFLDNPGLLPIRHIPEYSNPEMCQTCHPRQFEQWSGSTMAYSAISPAFNALEAMGNAYSVSQGRPGFAAGNHGTALFCQSCHNPVDSALGNFPTLADSSGHAMRDFASKVGRHGISCDVCHQISAPDTSTGLGRLGDGIANTAYVLSPGSTKFGPLDNVQPNPMHDSFPAIDINGQGGYLRTSEFCGTCHDVRTPTDAALANPVDPETGEPFQRLENLFTEWKNGPYGPINNQLGVVVSCQDCHMDLGPPKPAGSYAKGKTTVFPRPSQVVKREEVRTHYFTGIDITLVDFPGQDDATRDSDGNLIGQVQRRKMLMASAAEITMTAPSTISDGDTLPIVVHVTNSGTGHNLPSGFSQERQIWVELIVSDANGAVIYESGTLRDTSHPETGEFVPDGNLDDEDLRNLVGPDGFSSGVIDPVTLEANVIHGPDYNRRHEHPPVNQGLANFGNEFIRIPVDENGIPLKDEDGHFIEEEVFMPFLSTHTNNSFSIPALETANVPYDVVLPAGTVGPIQVTTRLRARAFPPRFLRALATGRPDLVNEKMVDRNRVVEMVTASPVSIQVLASNDVDGDGVGDNTDNCTQVPNVLQLDTDLDGYGNFCDADLNNDLSVNLSDYSSFRTAFSTADPVADFNGDGSVDLTDFSLFRAMFGNAPGPSGLNP